MHKRIWLKTVAALAAFSTEAAWARGGSCHSSMCSIFSGLILLVLLLFFVVSVAEGVKKKGWLKGAIQHGGVQAILIYAATIVIVPVIFVVSMGLIGKEETVALGLTVWALLMWRYVF